MRSLVLVLLVAVAACAPASYALDQVDVAALKQAKADAKVAVLVDVRTPEEYAAGHVPGAINVPLDRLETRLAELERYKTGPVHVICQSGRRSQAASAILEKAGFHPVDVAGGTGAWAAAGYPLER